MLGRRSFLTLTSLAFLDACSNGDSSGPSDSTGGQGGASATGGQSGTGGGIVPAGGGGNAAGGAGGMASGGASAHTGGAGGWQVGTGGVDGGGPTSEVDLDPEDIEESTATFPRTVIAGEMTSDSFMMCVYVADKAPKTMMVWLPGSRPGTIDVVAEYVVTPDEHGFVKTRVTRLLPGTWYSYAFFTGTLEDGLQSRSLVGRVRTALADGVKEPVTVAIAACVGSGISVKYIEPDSDDTYSWPSMARAGEQALDVFLHLGDQGYMDEIFDAGGTYELYLRAWGAVHGGGYRDVYPNQGCYFTWDDHEVTDNGNLTPWDLSDDDAAKLDAAVAAYFTTLPIDAATRADRLWRSFRWGDTVEFIVLDCRYERNQPLGKYLGDEQFAWLKERLRDSPCTFKCVVNSVPFATLGPFPSDADRWEGYPEQRDELREFIEFNGIKGILWVTGDIHCCYVGTTEESGDGIAGDMMEVCVTSGNENPGASLLPSKQFSWKSSKPHVPVITFDPEEGTAHVRFIDTSGNEAYERTLQLA